MYCIRNVYRETLQNSTDYTAIKTDALMAADYHLSEILALQFEPLHDDWVDNLPRDDRVDSYGTAPDYVPIISLHTEKTFLNLLNFWNDAMVVQLRTPLIYLNAIVL